MFYKNNGRFKSLFENLEKKGFLPIYTQFWHFYKKFVLCLCTGVKRQLYTLISELHVNIFLGLEDI